MMKKSTFLIFFIAFCFGLASCSESDLSGQKYVPEVMPKPTHLETIMPGDPNALVGEGISRSEEPTRIPLLDLEVLFEDDFSDSSSGWDVEYYDTGSTEYMGDAYRIIINKDSQYIWGNPYLDFGDVIVEVETRKLSGDDDDYLGIICRHYDIDNYYALTISSDGFSIIKKRTADGIENINNYVQSDIINQGLDGSNLLRAECIGDRLTLYVNGEFVTEAYDAEIATGDVGLIAGTISASHSDIRFDNFIVYQP